MKAAGRGFAAAAAATAGIAALALCAGCSPQRQPVIPHAAFTERETHRDAIEGRDTTLARLVYPEFLGARTPEALDSLRAKVHALAVAPAGSRKAPAASIAGLLDGFVSEWNETRRATRSRAYWRFERRIEVLAETLGVVSLSVSEFAYVGGAHPNSTRRLVNVGADDGRALGFADLFREELRDSLSHALEPLFRAARGVAADSTLRSAGFTFADDRLHLNDNVAITRNGVLWHFDAYEIAPYTLGPTDLVVPFDLVRQFARDDSPLGKSR